MLKPYILTRFLLLVIGVSFIAFNLYPYHQMILTMYFVSDAGEGEKKREGEEVNHSLQDGESGRNKLIEDLRKENSRLKALLLNNASAHDNNDEISRTEVLVGKRQHPQPETLSRTSYQQLNYSKSVHQIIFKEKSPENAIITSKDVEKTEAKDYESNYGGNGNVNNYDQSYQEEAETTRIWNETFAFRERVENALKWAVSDTKHIDWSLIGKGEIHILYKLKKYLQHLMEDYRTPEMMKLRLYGGMQCSESHATYQEEVLKTVNMDICSEIEWYKVAQLALPSARTFMDIGANKGYLASLFISLWGGGGIGINPRKVFDSAKELNLWKGSRNPAGFCKDGNNHGIALYCSSRRFDNGSCMDQNLNIKVYSVDGSSTITEQMNGLIRKLLPNVMIDDKLITISSEKDSNFVNSTISTPPIFTKASIADDDTLPIKFKPSTIDYLVNKNNENMNRILKYTGYKIKEKEERINTDIWSYWNYAMSDKLGKATFTKQGKDEKVGPGFEGGKINAKPSGVHNVEEVNMTTVDDLLKLKDIKSLDILKIDAEGHDNKVITGAMEVIEKKILMFVFEGYGWLSGEMISTFDDLGYSCYSSSKAGLYKWNANCLADDIILKKKEKGNVFCASRIRAPMIALSFDGLSFPGMLDEIRRGREMDGMTENYSEAVAKDEELGKSFVSWKSFCKEWPHCALS